MLYILQTTYPIFPQATYRPYPWQLWLFSTQHIRCLGYQVTRNIQSEMSSTLTLSLVSLPVHVWVVPFLLNGIEYNIHGVSNGCTSTKFPFASTPYITRRWPRIVYVCLNNEFVNQLFVCIGILKGPSLVTIRFAQRRFDHWHKRHCHPRNNGPPREALAYPGW